MTDTTTLKQPIKYSDLLLDLSAHPVTGDLAVVENDASIKQALNFLFTLKPYEKLFQSNIRSPLYQYLFEPATPITLNLLHDAIFELCERYEKRIRVLKIDVKSTSDEHGYNIKLFYKTFDTTQVKRFDFFLERTK